MKKKIKFLAWVEVTGEELRPIDAKKALVDMQFHYNNQGSKKVIIKLTDEETVAADLLGDP